MRTTKGGPHGHVHPARNFISESGRPCVFHAARKRHDAIPIDNHAIYTHCHAASTIAARAEEKKRASVTIGNDGVANGLSRAKNGRQFVLYYT
jgi:hypothetical protein